MIRTTQATMNAAMALFIEPGSPWESGFIESFNGKLRDELLNLEIFDTMMEAKVLIERWRQDYDTIRLHSSLADCPPAPEAIQPRTFDTGNSNKMPMAQINETLY